MEKAIGLNKWELFLALRDRYQLICKDLGANEKEHHDIKYFSEVNNIDIKFVEIEKEVFEKEIVFNAIKKHYDKIID